MYGVCEGGQLHLFGRRNIVEAIRWSVSSIWHWSSARAADDATYQNSSRCWAGALPECIEPDCGGSKR